MSEHFSTPQTFSNQRRTYEATERDVTSAGFFMGAVGTNVPYSTFNEFHGPVKIVPDGNRSLDLHAMLKPVERTGYYVTRCMDGTREHIFQEIDEWLDDVVEPNILWLSGSPGVGKSAIASSMVSRLIGRNRLGASFFFRRGDDISSDPAALWRTVSYNLSQHDPTFASTLVEVLREKKDILTRPDINLHFRYLIKEPLEKCYKDSTPPVIVIDALDECDAVGLQAAQRRDLLKTLIGPFGWSRLPKEFKLIVTGRDDHVLESFRTACKRMVLPTGVEVDEEANKDIRNFFEERFEELPGSTYPKWPGEKVLCDLTARAAGLFIWAETVMRLLEKGLPDERLKLILSGNMGERDRLTTLYCQLLDLAFRDVGGSTLEVYRAVLSAIVLAKIPFHYDDLPRFLSQPESSVKYILDKLSSVITIGSVDKRVQIGHISFSEFVCNPGRCPEIFFINRDKGSYGITMNCFLWMKKGLKFNICNLETSHLPNDQVENLPNRIKMNIPDPLSYSCRYWAAHLRDIASSQEGHGALLDEVEEFFYNRFLFWLEVMSFFKQTLGANSALLTVTPWIENFASHLVAFVRDARRFIINFDFPISDSVPHIYLSALPFSPSKSLVAQRYQPQFQNTLSVTSGRANDWPAMVNLFRGHVAPVNSVAFSPNGKRVVSGSLDNTIRIWDVETGQNVTGPFEGHHGSVSSAAFSRDGKLVVSGSFDKTVCIWDAETSQIVAGPYSGHTELVTSVAFSPDGRLVVSGSWDNTIRIWDMENGHIATAPFEDFTGSLKVTSVAFSPDGKLIAWGSDENVVYIWDIETGQIITGSSVGHNRWVNPVAFSPDSRRVVSGSFDNTICIWEVETGEVNIARHGGHTNSIASVAFSPDGKLVVSGSYDNTIRVWDAGTGRLIKGPFEGHTSFVFSVMFSPDAKRIVSGSSDHTIRIWDVETSQITARPSQGHIDTVTSVMFSPNGKWVASGSYDGTIRIWDVETGQITKDPFRRHTSFVCSIMFSPDSERVVSGSCDTTIIIWDVETGQITNGPLQGHNKSVAAVMFSPDGKMLVSGLSDMTVRIWDVETGRITKVFEGHAGFVCSVMFSPNGMQVASGSSDRTIRIWDVETGKITTGPFTGHTASVNCVRFSSDGKLLVSGSDDESIRIWDVETGQCIKGPFEGHTSSVKSVAFSPDGKWIASGSSDITIRVWDVETGQVIAEPFKGHTHGINSVAFSPDGMKVVSGSFDNTIRIWNVGNSSPRIESHEDIPNFVGDVYHLDPSGWAIVPREDGKNPLLFWVPKSSRVGLCGDATAVVIGANTTRLNLRKFVHGKSWTQCYSPQLLHSHPTDTYSRTSTRTSF